MRQALEAFPGLTDYLIYKAQNEGRLHPLQINGSGRVYYAEWELEAVQTGLGDLSVAFAA